MVLRCSPQLPDLPGPLDPTSATSLLVCPLLAFIVPAESLLLASASLLSLGSHLHPTSGLSLSAQLLCIPPSPSAVPEMPRPAWGQLKGCWRRSGGGLLGRSGLRTREERRGPGPRGVSRPQLQHGEVRGRVPAAFLLLLLLTRSHMKVSRAPRRRSPTSDPHRPAAPQRMPGAPRDAGYPRGAVTLPCPCANHPR